MSNLSTKLNSKAYALLSEPRNTLLQILILIIAMGFVFSPLMRANYTYIWQPDVQGSEINVPLADSRINSFSIEYPCSIGVDKNEEWLVEFFHSQALQISLSSEFVAVTSGHIFEPRVKQFLFDRSVSSDSNCFEKIFYSRENRQISYQSGEIFSEIEVNDIWAFQISGVGKWNKNFDATNVTLEIVSDPIWATKISTQKIIFGFVLLGLFIFYIFYKSFYPKINIKPRLSLIDIFVFTGIILLSLITLPDFDDGWYLSITKQLNETGFYNNYSTPNPRPTGYLYAVLLSPFTIVQSTIFGPKLIALFSIGMSWIVISRSIMPRLFSTVYSKKRLLFIAILFLWFSSGFLFVLRPEPILMLMLTIVLGIIATTNESNISSSIFWVILIAGTSVALHPAGLTTVFAGSPFVLYQLYKNFKKHFWTAMSAASFSISIMFLNSSPKWFLIASNGYTQGVLPGSNEALYVENVNFYDEWLRVSHLLSNVSSPLQVITGLFLAFFPIIFLPILIKTFRSKQNINLKLLVLSSYFSYLGLIFLNIKWSMYYGILVPSLIILIAIFKDYLININLTPIKKYSLSLIYPLLFICFFLMSIFYSLRCDFDLCSFDLGLFSNMSYLFYLDNLLYFFLLLFLFLLVMYLLKQLNILYLWQYTLIFLAIISMSLPVAAAVKDISNSNSGWSLYRQNLYGVFNSDAYCGIFGTYFPENELTQVAITEISNERLVTMPNLYHATPCSELVSIRDGLWEDPSFSLGWVPIYSIGKLGNNATFSVLGCSNMNRANSSLISANGFCSWAWETQISVRPKVKVDWKEY